MISATSKADPVEPTHASSDAHAASADATETDSRTKGSEPAQHRARHKLLHGPCGRRSSDAQTEAKAQCGTCNVAGLELWADACQPSAQTKPTRHQGSTLETPPSAIRPYACYFNEHTKDIVETLAVFQLATFWLKVDADVNICQHTTRCRAPWQI
jgi:hypothetical protein